MRADLVLGYRDLSACPHALPAHARFGNALVCGSLRLMLGTSFRDLPSFKAIRAEALEELDMREMTYGWTVEMLVKAARRGLRVEQLPVGYRARRGGRSKVAGDLRGSLAAGYKLVSCAFGYSVRSRWATAGGRSPG